MGPVQQPLSLRPTLQEHSTQQQLQQQRRQQAAEEAPQPQPMPPPALAAVEASSADAQPPQEAPRQQEAADAAPGRSPRQGVAHDWQQYSRSRQAASADSVLAPPADGPAVTTAVLSSRSLPVLAAHGRTGGAAAAAQEAGSGDALPPLVMPLTAATSLPLSVAGPEDADSPPGSPPAVNAVKRDIGSGAPAQVRPQPPVRVGAAAISLAVSSFDC